MKAYPKIHRINLILGLIAAGALLVGMYFFLTPATSSAKEGTQGPNPSSQAKPRSHACKDEVVLVETGYMNLVEPETFTLCQGGHGNGQHSVTWRKAPGATFVTFTVDFGKDTPLENSDQKPQSKFEIGPGSPPFVTGIARENLNIPAGSPRYYKYSVTVCRDAQETDCEEQDPGGIIMP
jgi:hypothetical protein